MLLLVRVNEKVFASAGKFVIMGDRTLAILVTGATIAFVVNVILACIAGATEGVVFKSRTGDISKRHETLVTPIGWTFMIWNVIFLTVGAALLYLSWNIRRENSNGLGKLYCNPAIFSKGASIAFIINQIFFITWLFVWDTENMTASAIILVGILISNWTTLVMISRNLFKATGYLSSTAPKDLWYYRILVQNSLGMYTAWTTLAALLNINIALIHDVGVGNQTGSLLCLCLILAFIVGWFSVDIFYLDRFFRYLITPYLTLTWGLTGIQVKLLRLPQSQDSEKTPVMYFVTALLALLVLLTFLKAAVTVYRHAKKPLTE
ncbi:unnamed protein product [Allacma fusca]|uniref:Uncharacterized protein n=1 Tax=Allacma fusca TaxID=39272 RepID=A0A8J2LF32_9HEXA|nr:unnamed protein product [Allacma fusca]